MLLPNTTELASSAKLNTHEDNMGVPSDLKNQLSSDKKSQFNKTLREVFWNKQNK
jgi:hypothetical protein